MNPQQIGFCNNALPMHFARARAATGRCSGHLRRRRDRGRRSCRRKQDRQVFQLPGHACPDPRRRFAGRGVTSMTDAIANRQPLEGGCTCRKVRYRVETPPFFVHCCHCSLCQRETGSAFAVNVLIETSRVSLLAGEIATISIPSASGRGECVTRCRTCFYAPGRWTERGI